MSVKPTTLNETEKGELSPKMWARILVASFDDQNLISVSDQKQFFLYMWEGVKYIR